MQSSPRSSARAPLPDCPFAAAAVLLQCCRISSRRLPGLGAGCFCHCDPPAANPCRAWRRLAPFVQEPQHSHRGDHCTAGAGGWRRRRGARGSHRHDLPPGGRGPQVGCAGADGWLCGWWCSCWCLQHAEGVPVRTKAPGTLHSSPQPTGLRCRLRPPPAHRCVLTFAPSQGLPALQVVGKVLHEQAVLHYTADAQVGGAGALGWASAASPLLTGPREQTGGLCRSLYTEADILQRCILWPAHSIVCRPACSGGWQPTPTATCLLPTSTCAQPSRHAPPLLASSCCHLLRAC